MRPVIDTSATLAWIHDDEITDSIRAVFDIVVEDGALVPALWRLEVANALTMAVRRKRVPQAFRAAALADLAMLDIAVDAETDAHAWSNTLALADRFGLTLYDAAYLELAHRVGAPLATLDRALRTASVAAGVRLLGVADS